MKHFRKLIAAATLVMASQFALAQGVPTFESLDTNGDQKLDKAEVDAWHALIKSFGIDVGENSDGLMQAFDTNKDGVIDAEEFKLVPNSV